MVDAPRQNWNAYDARILKSDAEWIRGLSIQDRFAIYEDAFNLIWSSEKAPGDWSRVDRWRWGEKLAHRLRAIDAFTKLDRVQCERATANNAG